MRGRRTARRRGCGSRRTIRRRDCGSRRDFESASNGGGRPFFERDFAGRPDFNGAYRVFLPFFDDALSFKRRRPQPENRRQPDGAIAAATRFRSRRTARRRDSGVGERLGGAIPESTNGPAAQFQSRRAARRRGCGSRRDFESASNGGGRPFFKRDFAGYPDFNGAYRVFWPFFRRRAFLQTSTAATGKPTSTRRRGCGAGERLGGAIAGTTNGPTTRLRESANGPAARFLSRRTTRRRDCEGDERPGVAVAGVDGIPKARRTEAGGHFLNATLSVIRILTAFIAFFGRFFDDALSFKRRRPQPENRRQPGDAIPESANGPAARLRESTNGPTTRFRSRRTARRRGCGVGERPGGAIARATNGPASRLRESTGAQKRVERRRAAVF